MRQPGNQGNPVLAVLNEPPQASRNATAKRATVVLPLIALLEVVVHVQAFSIVLWKPDLSPTAYKVFEERSFIERFVLAGGRHPLPPLLLKSGERNRAWDREFARRKCDLP